MKISFALVHLIAGVWLLTGAAQRASAQGAGVPVYAQDNAAENRLQAAAAKLRDAGALLRDNVFTNQFNRASCTLAVPARRDTHLASRELWETARASHLRVGWFYHCTQCGKWHLNLAAGYAVSQAGAVATCFHVVQPPESAEENYLLAADETGQLIAVTEILAANADTDTCIVRLRTKNLKPLALNTNIFPGDRCVCFSDPLGERGYFSDGIVSRFVTPRSGRNKTASVATRLDVTTDWAPGSSGAAVLDECGNAIGHVTAISTLSEHGTGPARGRGRSAPTLITIHEAVSAKDVLALIRKPGK